MKSSKKSGLQSPTNATTKPNTDTKQGVCNKEKFALWAYPDIMNEVSAAYENDNELYAIVRALNKYDDDEVHHINGCIDFDCAVRFQNDREDE